MAWVHQVDELLRPARMPARHWRRVAHRVRYGPCPRSSVRDRAHVIHAMLPDVVRKRHGHHCPVLVAHCPSQNLLDPRGFSSNGTAGSLALVCSNPTAQTGPLIPCPADLWQTWQGRWVPGMAPARYPIHRGWHLPPIHSPAGHVKLI